MAVYTTEIASENISSDNPIHQRLLKAYYLAKPYIKGDLLEVGCGEGRGVNLLAPDAASYLAIDKIQSVIDELSARFPDYQFVQGNVPPFSKFEDCSFDTLVSFQVIEHIRNDKLFLKEIHRVLKPGGRALITTPNIKKTLTRNPWHEREYTARQLEQLANEYFEKVELMGVTGNEKVWKYYNRNRESVKKITRWDILNLQYRLPARMLKIPYDFLNRLNRDKLEKTDDTLVTSISHKDYLLSDEADSSLDLFGIFTKAND